MAIDKGCYRFTNCSVLSLKNVRNASKNLCNDPWNIDMYRFPKRYIRWRLCYCLKPLDNKQFWRALKPRAATYNYFLPLSPLGLKMCEFYLFLKCRQGTISFGQNGGKTVVNFSLVSRKFRTRVDFW